MAVDSSDPNGASDVAVATAGGGDDNLSALSWVRDELRRSLDLAHKALRRYLKEQSQRTDLDSVDPSVLRQARNQLHQCVGVLELVGLGPAAELPRAAEAALQRLSARPKLITSAAVDTLEQGAFALLDFIDRRLAGKPVSALALFPQYKALQELAGALRVHPADLWHLPWAWRDLALDTAVAPRHPDADTTHRIESDLLAHMRGAPAGVATRMSEVFAGLAAGAQQRADADDAASHAPHSRLATLWQLAAAFFEAQADGLLQADAYSKRLGSKLLAQLRAGEQAEPSERLAQDLLFFCSQASVLAGRPVGPRLGTVRQGYGLHGEQRVDYDNARLGRFDPAWVAQARKRVGAAKEVWSAVAGGDTARLDSLSEQFTLVSDSLGRLYADGATLGRALQVAAAHTVATQAEPPPDLAMEVATALLYLDASIEDADFDHPEAAQRVLRLAQRIDAVRQSRDPGALDLWMEELYRRVSDRQTMGSVVQELRAALSEVEKNIDQYFRDPAQRDVLIPVPAQLQAMRGVLSVLGLDQASQAVLRMRDEVDALANTEVNPQHAIESGTFDRLADNLGALSFLIDMVSVQPQMAKSLFRFDAASGNLTAVMARQDRPTGFDGLDTRSGLPAGSTRDTDALAVGLAFDRLVEKAQAVGHAAPPATEAAGALGNHGLPMLSMVDMPSLEDAPTLRLAPGDGAEPTQAMGLMTDLPTLAMPPPVASPAPATDTSGLEDDPEMREIFLEEAREVLEGARQALDQLQDRHDDPEAMTTVRRAFHTLKGSARMVGLKAFGEAAWACEQLYNTRLAEHAGADADLRGFSLEACGLFEDWVQALADGDAGGHGPQALVQAADSLRVQRVRLPLQAGTGSAPLPGSPPPPEPPASDALQARVPGLPLASDLDLATPARADSGIDLPALDLADLDLGLPDRDAAPPAPAPAALPDALAPMAALPEATELDLSLDFQATFGTPAAPAPAAAPEAPPAAPVFDTTVVLTPADRLPPPEAPPDDGLPDLPLDLPDAADTAAAALDEAADTSPGALDDRGAAAPREPEDGGYRQVGPLRIGLPLFNIYLNEADELSRRLGVELAEWSQAPQRPVGDAAVALAHSLAGSSGTVGYAELSQLARALEHALERTQARGHAQGDEPALYRQAADEIGRLLHQFAAGFLKSPDPDLLDRLQVLAHAAPAPTPQPGPEIHAEPVPEPAPPAEAAAAPAAPAETAAADAAQAVFGRATLMPLGALPEAPVRALRADGPLADAGFEDDIDQVDAVDAELFPFFIEEAQELLPALHAGLRDWARHPDDAEARKACMRSLHTFKGSARLAGAMRLGEMAHRLESMVERLAAAGAAVDPAEVEALAAPADALQTRLEALQRTAEAEPAADAPVAAHAEPAAHAPPTVLTEAADAAEALPAAAPVPAPTPAAPAAVPEPVAAPGPAAVPPAPARVIDWQRFATAPVPTGAPLVTPGTVAAAAGSVRVRTPLLDRLVNQAGEVSIARSRIESDVHQIRSALADLTDNLERLRAQLRDIELQAETQIDTRMEAARAAAQAFDPLEMDRFTRFQELTRMMAESVADVATVQRGLHRTLQSTEDALAHQARMTRDMQDDLLRTRMVEFEGLSERLYRVVRQAAKETGKPVRLDILGGSVEIDRGVLDRMTPAFEHLLRNSVVHGIESAEDRRAAGKDATGTVTLSVTQEGNEVGVEVRDDGAGLNLPRILARARAMDLVADDEQPDDVALANLIFQPGFTTASNLTDLAGRGVGMDVVRTEVNAMGGRIETASAAGQGASFRLVLPLTTAVTQVVMLRCGERAFAVPSTLIEMVHRVPAADLAQAYASGSFDQAGQALPFFWFDALLGGTARGAGGGRTASIVVIRSAQQRVVLHVDEVQGNQDVVVKNLGPQLSRVPGLVGMTLLPSGLPALIYNPVALVTLYGDDARAALARATAAGAHDLRPATAEPLAPLVLVVDDSLTVRRITQRLLEREGYRVQVAKDGLDGLDKLAAERPAVLLTDIEMPRMDGFDLVRNMRADDRLARLPVIMITSRIAQKHRDYAVELGVNHYLGKPYAEDELLGLVARYARPVAALAGP